MKKIAKAVCAASLCAAMILSGCSGDTGNTGSTSAQATGSSQSSTPQKPTKASVTESLEAGNSGTVTLQSGDTYAVISIKDYGDIKIKLYPDEAPYAVYNFVELAKKGTYNGRNFHRILEDFMAQGGSATGEGTGGDSFEGGAFRNEINTSLRHYYGALCYASAGGDMTDQFYIVNNKKPQTDLTSTYETYISYYSQNAEAAQEMLAQVEAELEAGTDIYNMYHDYYASQYDFSVDTFNGVQAMLNTVTQAVESTYADKGGVPFLDGGYTVFGQTVEGFEVIDKITAVEKELGSDNAISKPVTDIIIDKVEIFTME